MKLEGIHHVTSITGDAPQNVEFYAGTLGLRLSQEEEYDGADLSIHHISATPEREANW